MSRSWQRCLAVILLSAYIVGGVFLEVAHHDHLALILHTDPVMNADNGGAKEPSRSPDGTHICPVCFQASQRNSTPATSYVPAGDRAVYIVRVPVISIHLPATHNLLPDKRGPPALPL